MAYRVFNLDTLSFAKMTIEASQNKLPRTGLAALLVSLDIPG